MKIIHLNTERTWRGGEQQMCYLAAGLQALGHESIVACRPGSPCMERARGMGLRVEPLKLFGDLDLAGAYRLAKLADRENADILHAHSSRTHLAAVWGKQLAKRKVRCVVHRRVDFSLHKLPLRLSGLKYRWGVDRYIAITEAVKAVMVRDGIPPEKISVVYSSTDLGRFEGIQRRPGLRDELGVAKDARLAGTIGALVGHKGHRYYLDAIAMLRREFPDLVHVIIGEGPLRAALEEQARALGITDRLSMPGFRSDIPHCLAEFDVFCMPSTEEGLGTSVLDAMAMRVPVVAANAGGLKEVVRDGVNGLLVPIRDPNALASAISRLLKSGALMRQMGAAGRQTVESRFTVARMVESTADLYESLK